MAVLFYSLCLLTLIGMTVAYILRDRWIHHFPTPSYLYTALPTSFRGDVEAGLHSADFDMTGNITDGDSRSGLDENGKREILKIMKRRGVNFDEARRLYMEKNFKKAGISADGLPNDPKFVSFS